MEEIRIKPFENTNNRTVVLSEEVSSGSVSNVKKEFLDIIGKDYEIFNENIRQLKTLSDELAEVYSKTIEFPPINFEINSIGGTVYDGLGLYDYIKDICDTGKHKVIVKCGGCVASIATIIMLASPTRIAGKSSSFLIHSIAALEFGKVGDIVDGVKELNRLTKILHNIYIENTNLTEEELVEIDKLKKDYWIDSTEALKKGLITKIK